MEAGRLRSRILIQELIPTPVGPHGPTWTGVAIVWAEVIQASGDQSASSDQNKAVTTHKITLRQIPNYDITPGKNRIVYKGRNYNIISVTAVGNLNAYYEIVARNIVGPQGQA